MTTKHARARRGLLFKPALSAVLAMLALPSAQAATPGLPFTEDFSTTTLRDDALTNANWSPEEQAVYLAWSQRRQLPSFDAGSSVGTGSTWSVVLGDVNRNGHLDLIVGSENSAILLYINDGSGSFPANGIAIGSAANSAYALALGDVNGDGHPDLIAGNRYHISKLFLNDGNGGFPGTGVDIGTEVDQTTAAVLGDVNGDGHLDLITGNGSTTLGVGRLNRLYLNDGNGGFPVTGTPVGSEADFTVDLALADVDGDGDLDLIAGNFGETDKLYLNDGLGGFPATGIAVGIPERTVSLALGDVNGDGRLDLVSGGDDTRPLRLHRNNGAGGFLPATVISNVQGFGVTLTDLDGDGDLDLVAANIGTSQPNRVFLNDGSGGFPATGVALGSPGNSNSVAIGDLDGDGDPDLCFGNGRLFGPPEANVCHFNLGSVGFPTAATNIGTDSDRVLDAVLGDLNGDGSLDLVIARGTASPRLLSYLNDGDGGFPATGTVVDAGAAPALRLALADVDGDGYLDLMVGNIMAADKLYLNDGNGGFLLPGTTIGSDTNTSSALAFGDVNGDGSLDLLVGKSSSPNLLYLNDGSGGFPGSGTAVGSESDSTRRLLLGDLDGDGDLDVVVANGIGETNKAYFNDGTGGFSATGSDIGSETDSTGDLVLGDVDGDGDLDVIAGNGGTTNKLYLNDGSGGFPATGIAVGSETDATAALALADVDQDGDLDLIAGNGGQINKLYLNDGSGGFSATGIDIGSETDLTTKVLLGDLDGDGDLDLVAANNNAAEPLRRYLNGRRGAFRPAISLGTETDSTRSLAIGDVDRDGYLDVVTGNDGQTNKLYLNDGSNGFPLLGIEVGSETDATYAVVLADVDRDGALDLLVGNSGQTNKLYLNDGSGGFPATGTDVGGETDATRALVLGDIDRDGDLDLIAGNYGQTNKLYLNDGSGGFPATGTAIGSDTGSTTSLALGDINRDGALDLIVGNDGQANRLHLNSGSGGFLSGSNIGNRTDNTRSVVLGDVDRDGDLDLVVGNAGQTNRLHLNTGSGFPVGGAGGSGFSVGSESDATHSLALADIDADGDLDLIVGNAGQVNKLYRNDGSGGFPTTGTAFGSETETTHVVLLGDIDRDGDLDLIVGNNGANRLHRFASFITDGRAVSTQVSAGESMRAVNLSATEVVNTAGTRNTNIDYFVSNDGGAIWHRAVPGQDVHFPSSGTDLRWKAELRSLSPSITPLLTELRLDLVPTEPEAPLIGTATAGDASASVNFIPPANNGSAISAYTATSDPGAISGGCTDSPCIVTGLSNGTEYTFTVTATNAAGTSPASAPSNAVTPLGTQIIVFDALPDRILGEPPFEVSATGGASGNPVTFASQTEAVCSTGGTNGSTMTLLALGTCTIRASQAGSAAFSAADDVDRSFLIVEALVFRDGFE